MRSHRRVLKGYKQSGKRYTPPFLDMFGRDNFQEVNWIHNFVPELLWIGLIFKLLPFNEAYEIVLSIGDLALKVICPTGINLNEVVRWFAPASSFNTLSEQEKKLLQSKLKQQSYFQKFVDSLRPLFKVFPEYPLCSLFKEELLSGDENQTFLRETLKEMLPRHDGLLANRVQLIAVDLAIQSKAMTVLQGLSLNRIDEAKEYPQTEDSERIMSAVRCALSASLQFKIEQLNTKWHDDLWYRFRSLEKCCFETNSQGILYDLIYIDMTKFY